VARFAILGNGSLTVGIDEKGLVHDFYYPFVGLENLNTARSDPHYIGIWVDGVFSWLHDSAWKVEVKLHQHAMITQSRHVNDELKISLSIESFVDVSHNTFVRHVIVHNSSNESKEIRLFFHQAFQISRLGRSDTALYVPDEHYLLDYKGRCVLLIKAALEDGRGFDQYAVGNYGIEGKDGTFRDAEDGELSMNAVEHAGVDSVLRLSFKIEPGNTQSVNYWVVVASSQFNARKQSKELINEGIMQLIHRQLVFWQEWLYPAQKELKKLNHEHKKAVVTSLLTIKAHIDSDGGIIASCDSSIYNYGRDYYSYVWPRDGAFTIWPLIRLGIYDEPKKFFEFCRDILSEGGYMLHKYQPDKAVGSTWHPLIHNRHEELAIQEDETALIIFMLGEYVEYSGDQKFAKSLYTNMIQPMANFMSKYVDKKTGVPHASYDLWEEKFLSTVFSSAITSKALKVASQFAKKFGFQEDSENWLKASDGIKNHVDIFYNYERKAFRKGLLLQQNGEIEYDNTLDVSSLYGSFMFDFASSNDQISATATAIEKELLDKSPSGGTPRYENDGYFKRNSEYKGNPWFVTTFWVAQYYNHIGKSEIARKYLEWGLKNALPSGMLSEQIDPVDGSHVGVTPLVWSHAELINTILDLN
jgi:GH15 family glucan-1,4-alpha-glucosidase